MAYQNIDRKDLIKAIRSRSIKEEMEGVMDVAGQDAIWRHDPNIKYGKWDGKTSFGVKPDQPWISLKTSESAVRRLITRYKNSYIRSTADPIIINGFFEFLILGFFYPRSIFAWIFFVKTILVLLEICFCIFVGNYSYSF